MLLGALACSPAPEPRQLVPPTATAGTTATLVTSAAIGTTTSAPAKVEVPALSILGERLAEAYRKRVSGDAKGADEAFRALIAMLVAAGEAATPGLGGLQGEVVAGTQSAGLSATAGGAQGTYFFDANTGIPFAFAPEVTLWRDAPALVTGHFATTEGEQLQGLYDPQTDTSQKLPGKLVALNPDGQRAYLFGDDCQIVEWLIDKGSPGASLRPHFRKRPGEDLGARLECDPNYLHDAAVTADGKWLTTRFGRWNLGTHAHKPLPFQWSRESYSPAVSPDGRYVGQVIRNPKAPLADTARATLLVLHDMEKGTSRTGPEPLSALSNGDPLSFGAEPPRVCVFDYGFYAFHVPSLKPFADGDPALIPSKGPLNFGPSSCETKFVRPPARHPELRARLEKRVCSLHGLLFPIESCPPPAKAP